MPLPNPTMVFTPFDTLPASDLNKIVANVNSLAAGTGLNDGAVTGNKILNYKVQVKQKTVSTTVNNAVIQNGWDFVPGASANSITKSFTFPVAFNSIPVIQVGGLGEKSDTDPTDIGQMTGIAGSFVQVVGASTTGFTVAVVQRDTANLIPSIRYGFSWIAIGN